MKLYGIFISVVLFTNSTQIIHDFKCVLRNVLTINFKHGKLVLVAKIAGSSRSCKWQHAIRKHKNIYTCNNVGIRFLFVP